MQSTTLIRRATRWVGAAMLLGACALALALPSPKDIEAAVNAGHLAQAEAMLREVLQEKPNSARAHYELGQVLAREAQYESALAELQSAKTIDSSLKFATSPEKYQQTLDKIKAAASAGKLRAPSVATPVAPVTAPAAAPAPASPGLNLNYVLLGVGVLVLVALLIRRNSAQVARSATPYPAPMPNPAGPVGFGAQYAPNGPAYSTGYGPGYGAPQGGSGLGGAVLGGVAGLAAGYALTKAFEGEHPAGHNSAPSAPAATGGYVPFDTPAQPDLGSFDSGTGDSWDAGDSSGGDENW